MTLEYNDSYITNSVGQRYEIMCQLRDAGHHLSDILWEDIHNSEDWSTYPMIIWNDSWSLENSDNRSNKLSLDIFLQKTGLFTHRRVKITPFRFI